MDEAKYYGIWNPEKFIWMIGGDGVIFHSTSKKVMEAQLKSIRSWGGKGKPLEVREIESGQEESEERSGIEKGT